MSRRGRLRKLLQLEDAPRRRFLLQGLAVLVGGALVWWRRAGARVDAIDARVGLKPGTLPIRPPGALPHDADFIAACISCGLCGDVCESGCIRFLGLEDGRGPLTPYIDVRRRSCTLCMHCTNICPSGALRPIEHATEAIKAEVRMGVAEVNPELCISYLGRLCGYCHDACPLPNHAIKLVPRAIPIVLADGCVGCGRCVEQCPQTPTAIDVIRRVT